MPLKVWAVPVMALALPALWPAGAPAQVAPPYAQLVRQTLGVPRVVEADAAVAEAEALAEQAGMRLNPTLGLSVENALGSGPFRGLDEAETTVSVEQVLERGGKREARVSAGRAEIDAARARGLSLRAQIAADLADAYVAAEAADRRFVLAQETASLAQEDARIAGILVEAGKEADVRSVQARAALEFARAGVDQARSDQAAAVAQLSALAAASFTAVTPGLLEHADLEEPLAAPDPLASPAYAAAVAEREVAQRKVRVEETRARSDIAVSLGVRHFAGDDAGALIGGVSMPLSVRDRNRGGIAASKAALRAAEARVDAARLDATAASRAAGARGRAALSRIAAARSGEAAAEEAYRLSRIGYEGGKLPLSEVLAARRALADARNQTLDARLERLGAEVALARLSGAVPFGDQ